MHTAFIECELRETESIAEIGARLERLGIVQLPGFEPSLMRGDSEIAGTVMFTVAIPDAIDDAQLRRVPGVVAVFGDAAIAPFGGK